MANTLPIAKPRSPMGWWLLATVAVVALPHLLRMPSSMALGCLGLFAWRAAHQLTGFSLPGRAVRVVLTVSMLALVVVSNLTVLGREAGAHLLIAMLLLKLLEVRSERDIALVLVVSFFATISMFFFSQSLLIAAQALIAVLLLLNMLMAVVHPVDSWSTQREHLRHVLRLSLHALPLTVLLFFLFPRISAPLWGLSQSDAGHRTGLSDTLAPGQVSNLSDDDSVAFRVEFTREPPGESMYWRGLVLWHFDGNSWRAPHQLVRPPEVTPRTVLEVGGEPVDYAVTVEPHSQRWLFGLDMPASTPSGAQRTSSLELVVEDPLLERHRYELSSYMRYRLEGDTPPDARYRELPGGYGSRARALAAQWRAQGRNDAAVVEAALAHFATEPFFYTRQPPLLHDDLVDEFLFETRRGFCEHYAASMAFLMRAAGIPARVVLGYHGGEHNPLGDYYIVRQSNAHAWTEVWLPQQGWRRIDPTAVLPPDRIEAGTESVRERARDSAGVRVGERGWLGRFGATLAHGLDTLHHEWNRWIIGYDQRRQSELLDNLGLPDVDWTELAALLGATMSAVILLLATWVFVRRRAQSDAVRRLYARFCRKLSRKGLEPHRFETAADVQRRVERRLPERAAEVSQILGLYYRLRYQPAPEPGTLQALRRAVRRFRV